MDFNELFSILQTGDETDRIEAKKAANGVEKAYLKQSRRLPTSLILAVDIFF